MILIIRCGGLASFLTVDMSAALIVCRADSASSSAGLAASNLLSATTLSAYNIIQYTFPDVTTCAWSRLSNIS